MLNRVVIVGRLTRDPDLRYTPKGVAVANFTVAANRPFRKENGDQEADFINCVVWRKAAENLANYMKKGSMIGVDGRIQTRSYEGQDGKMVYVTEVLAENIQYLESRNGQGQSQESQRGLTPEPQQTTSQSKSNPFQSDGHQIDIQDDDLPF